jgi:hypothetical protein
VLCGERIGVSEQKSTEFVSNELGFLSIIEVNACTRCKVKKHIVEENLIFFENLQDIYALYIIKS